MIPILAPNRGAFLLVVLMVPIVFIVSLLYSGEHSTIVILEISGLTSIYLDRTEELKPRILGVLPTSVVIILVCLYLSYTEIGVYHTIAVSLAFAVFYFTSNRLMKKGIKKNGVNQVEHSTR
jgi:hypothetical protein